MKKARLLLSGALLAFAGMTTMTFTSCQDDEVCPNGYEGKDCATEVRTKFLGTYAASDIDQDGDTYTYTTSIAKDATDVTKMNIGNFSGLFDGTVTATTLSGYSFTIPNQEPDGDGYTVSGSGTISDNTISVSYTITQPVTSATTDYTGTWTK